MWMWLLRLIVYEQPPEIVSDLRSDEIGLEILVDWQELSTQWQLQKQLRLCDTQPLNMSGECIGEHGLTSSRSLITSQP